MAVIESYKTVNLQFPSQKVTLNFIVAFNLNDYIGVKVLMRIRGKRKQIYIPLNDVQEFTSAVRAIPKVYRKKIIKTIQNEINKF